jgi:hypothetical protein
MQMHHGGQNNANNALNAAVDGGASRDEIKALQEELDYAVTLVRQCEWMFENGYFLRAELETTGTGTANEAGLLTSPVSRRDWNARHVRLTDGNTMPTVVVPDLTQEQMYRQQVAATAAMAAAVPKPPTVLTPSAAPTAFTEANAERIRNEWAAV